MEEEPINMDIQSLERIPESVRLKNLIVPTDDKQIQARLRELGEPIILFGEEFFERRERLKTVMLRKGIENGMPTTSLTTTQPQTQVTTSDDSMVDADELFYTEGTIHLKNCRMHIAKDSVERAAKRLERAREIKKRDESDANAQSQKEIDEMVNDCKKFGRYVFSVSQVGDERPLSACTVSPDSKQVVTTSWSGLIKLWDSKTCNHVHSFKGHTDRCTAVLYHPNSLNHSNSSLNLVSAGADNRVLLWSLDKEEPLQELVGHEERVNRIAFHPTGKYLASASHDLTWHLWDIEAGRDLLEQEGHCRPIMAVGFHPDGSLLCSAGLDHLGRVWDLRSGKSVYAMRGHSKQIIELEWSTNGYQLATCSEDHTVRIWDLRKKKAFYTIPAHSNVINHVKYYRDGKMLMTSSFDRTIKFWNTADFSPIATINSGDGKVMYCDLAPNEEYIITVNYDRTWKFFADDGTSMQT
eukprot:TRINITY_DN6154_c0_g1_i1.p1 TRINITY_DN6154_c0_g1~~TRINITY_DN6154_c0_g1_i1.p1  ORF type:complete len:468 (+),score=112.15 TRINITY_DN6154_c0_g1_i1:121-1524(+)